MLGAVDYKPQNHHPQHKYSFVHFCLIERAGTDLVPALKNIVLTILKNVNIHTTHVPPITNKETAAQVLPFPFEVFLWTEEFSQVIQDYFSIGFSARHFENFELHPTQWVHFFTPDLVTNVCTDTVHIRWSNTNCGHSIHYYSSQFARTDMFFNFGNVG